MQGGYYAPPGKPPAAPSTARREPTTTTTTGPARTRTGHGGPEHGPTGAADDDGTRPGTHARSFAGGVACRASGRPLGVLLAASGTLPDPFRNPPDAFREPSGRIFSPRPSASELIDPYFLTFTHNFTGNIVLHGEHRNLFFNISDKITC